MLVAAAMAGQRDALESLLRCHHDRLRAVCRRITGDDADAADATQEAMIAIVRGLPRFDGRSSFSTWSHRVAVNASLDELRRRGRRPVAVLDGPASAGDADRFSRGAAPRVAASGPGDGDIAGPVAARVDLDAALGRLPVDHRVAVVLRDVSDLSYAEIAEVLAVPIGTVRSRIARGRDALASLLEPAGPLARLEGGGGA